MITLNLWKRPTINWLFVMERSKKTIFFFVTKQIRNWFCCGKNCAKYFFFDFRIRYGMIAPLQKAVSLTVLPSISYLPNALEVWVSLPSVVVAYGKWLLASTLMGKTDFGTFGELLAYKSLSAVLELMKINPIVVISIIYFYPYVKQRCVLISFKKIENYYFRW